MLIEHFDRVVIGSGIYGLYAAEILSGKGYKTLVIDQDLIPMGRGSLVNQARVHNGYHYPRSLSTAIKSSGYFERFYNDFEKFINGDFIKIYALARNYSWTNANQFKTIWDNLNIRCEEVDLKRYFRASEVEAAFATTEYTFDANLIGKSLYEKCISNGCNFKFSTSISSVFRDQGVMEIKLSDSSIISTPWVLNATYSGTNQIQNLFSFAPINIKYELCEVVLCEVDRIIKNVGITLMDGPFFSLMPFGLSKYHSLTTVSHTPHLTSSEELPTFSCQLKNDSCFPDATLNCNSCIHAPNTAFPAMRQMLKKYLIDDFSVKRIQSMYAIKAVLKTSEVDDSRPTLLRQYSQSPSFHTVFSGKINTLYDLDEIL